VYFTCTSKGDIVLRFLGIILRFWMFWSHFVTGKIVLRCFPSYYDVKSRSAIVLQRFLSYCDVKSLSIVLRRFPSYYDVKSRSVIILRRSPSYCDVKSHSIIYIKAQLYTKKKSEILGKETDFWSKNHG
jgi:hypothetical protein